MKKLLAILMSTVILASCTGTGSNTGNTTNTTNTTNENTSTEIKQEVTALYSSEVTTMNYLTTTTESEFVVAANCVDALIEYDKYGVVKPSLAESWEKSEDGLTWTFHLREGVKWVDNTGKEVADLKAQDFVDSMQYILTQANASESANIVYSVIENAEAYYNSEITDFTQVGVKAIDDKTVEYKLLKPVPYFLSMLTYVCFLPVNGEFLDAQGSSFGTDNTKLLYNGSYILSTFEPQSKQVYSKNETYWDKDNVFVTTITKTFNKEAGTISPEMYARGDINSAGIPASIIDTWMSDPTKKALIHPGTASYYTFFYAINFDPQFDAQYEPDNWRIAVNNKAFRKSLFHAFNRTPVMSTVDPYNPTDQMINTIVPKNFVDDNGVDYTELSALKNITTTDSFDEAKALEFKAQALKELEGKATFPVKVYMPYNSGGSDNANRAQIIEQQLEKLLGTDYIDVVIEAIPETGYLSATRRIGNYSVMEVNWGPDFADPETYTVPFMPGNNYNFIDKAEGYTEANGEKTYTNMVNAAVNETTDISKRYNLFAEAEAFLINEAFVIPCRSSNPGYTGSYLDPFDSSYSPFGLSVLKFKGQKLLEKPISMDEYPEKRAKWLEERKAALESANQ